MRVEIVDGKMRFILGHRSAHPAKETPAYLATLPNRLDSVFTPTHASGSTLIERCFAKPGHLSVLPGPVASRSLRARSDSDQHAGVTRLQWGCDRLSE
jgi:hypothetical protein